MVLTELDHVSRSFTLKPVLRAVTLHIGDREKIGRIREAVDNFDYSSVIGILEE